MANARNSKKQAIAKKLIKPIDVIFSSRPTRRLGVKVARVIIDRYTNYGSHVQSTGARNYSGEWSFMLDTPKLEKTTDKKAYVSGWFVPDKEVNYSLRVVYPSGKKVLIKSDIKRFDVAEELSNRLGRKIKLECGFGKNILVNEDGRYFIEIKMATQEWEKLTSFNLRYDPDFTVSDILNGNLAYNYAAHKNLISNKQLLYKEKAINGSFQPASSDVKLVAFYLPQYHPFKENDEWWGKGFTEWSNVAAAVPRYIGHEQPKLPADLGFYDLRIAENMKNQIDLAKNHGIKAFCFYYYWFSGKRLLETPLDTFLGHKEWNFNFMICWANENWTRRWDGRNQDVLMAQEHREDDPLKFIKDVEHILTDPRYLRVEDKPVLAVYRASDLQKPNDYAKIWRDYFKQKHGMDLHLLCVQSFSNENPADVGFDKGIEFVPLSISARLKKDIPRYKITDKILDVEFTGAMYDYREIALTYPSKKNRFPSYRSIMPAWDNDARRKGTGGVFADANPDLYGNWLDQLIREVNSSDTPNDEKIVFINAWNEWAEGAYLEPDTMYGHAYLNRTAQILAKNSTNSRNADTFPLYGIKRKHTTKLAVVAHMFYADMWPSFSEQFNYLRGVEYDLFITIPKKAEHIKSKILDFNPNAHIVIVPNRGRDVLPFLFLAGRLQELGYEYFLKVHSKKSTHRHDGNLWIKDMLGKLIPDVPEALQGIINTLELKDTGLVGPAGHYISLDAYFGSNENHTTALLGKTVGAEKAKEVVKHLNKYGFFAGTMFWGRFDALQPILDRHFQPSDFEPEAGQVDSTFAHAMERALSVVPYVEKRNMYTSDKGFILQVTGSGITSDYQYAVNKSGE